MIDSGYKYGSKPFQQHRYEVQKKELEAAKAEIERLRKECLRLEVTVEVLQEQLAAKPIEGRLQSQMELDRQDRFRHHRSGTADAFRRDYRCAGCPGRAGDRDESEPGKILLRVSQHRFEVWAYHSDQAQGDERVFL